MFTAWAMLPLRSDTLAPAVEVGQWLTLGFVLLVLARRLSRGSRTRQWEWALARRPDREAHGRERYVEIGPPPLLVHRPDAWSGRLEEAGRRSARAVTRIARGSQPPPRCP